jgi:hypothetical protein
MPNFYPWPIPNIKQTIRSLKWWADGHALGGELGWHTSYCTTQ